MPPGTEPGPGQIVYSNSFALAALARREGARCSTSASCPDRLDETIAGVRRARDAGADVLVTAGGASVGDYDLVQQALAAEGLALSFWKVAVRPGQAADVRPARRDARARPARQSGVGLCVRGAVPRAADPRAARPAAMSSLRSTKAVLGRDLQANDERADYMRATLDGGPDGTAVATPFPVQDSSMLVPLAAADCLVVREPHAPAAAAGSPCVFVKLRD